MSCAYVLLQNSQTYCCPAADKGMAAPILRKRAVRMSCLRNLQIYCCCPAGGKGMAAPILRK